MTESSEEALFFPNDPSGERGFPDHTNKRFSKELRAQGQTSLMALVEDRGAEIYRFTLIPSFSSSWSVVLKKSCGDFLIMNVEMSRRCGFPPRPLSADQGTAKVDPEDVAEFHKLFNASSFFTQSAKSRAIGLDGETWILEAVREENYHSIARWTPSYDTQKRELEPFVACCNWLRDHAPDGKHTEK